MALSEQEILSGLAEIVNEETGLAVDAVQPDKSFTDDLDIDSLSMMTIVVNAEEKFGVRIPATTSRTSRPSATPSRTSRAPRAAAARGRRRRRADRPRPAAPGHRAQHVPQATGRKARSTPWPTARSAGSSSPASARPPPSVATCRAPGARRWRAGRAPGPSRPTGWSSTSCRSRSPPSWRCRPPRRSAGSRPAASTRRGRWRWSAARGLARRRGARGGAERLGVVCASGIGGVWTLLSAYDVLKEKGRRRVFPLTVPMPCRTGRPPAIGIEIGARAGVHTPVAACASGAEAMAYGLDMIRSGRADVVVAGGTEAAIHPLPSPGSPRCKAGHVTRPPMASLLSPYDAPGRVRPPRERRGGVESAAPLLLRLTRSRRVRLARPAPTSDAHHISAVP